MDRLEKLPEVTEHVLDGLRADESLKHRILLSAAGTRNGYSFRFRTVFALCGLSVLVILLCVFAARIPAHHTGPDDVHMIPAGSRRVTSPVNLQMVIDQASSVIQESDNMKGTD